MLAAIAARNIPSRAATVRGDNPEDWVEAPFEGPVAFAMDLVF
jgi:hypothetical protein